MKTLCGRLKSSKGKDFFLQHVVKASAACCDCWEFVLKIYKYPNIPRHAKPEGSIKAPRVVNEDNLGIVSLHTLLYALPQMFISSCCQTEHDGLDTSWCDAI